MKKLCLSLMTVFALLLIDGCKSADDDHQPVVTNGDIAITGISVERPYVDDTFTLTGSGFDADMTKDSVAMGSYGDGSFYAFTKDEQRFTIKSATTNSVEIAAVDPDGLDKSLYTNSQYAFVVYSHGNVSDPFPVSLKRKFLFNLVANFNNPIIPGGNIYMTGRSFTDNCSMTMTVTRCQTNTQSQCQLNAVTQCDCDVRTTVPCDSSWDVTLSADGQNDLLTTNIPLSIFGELHNGCPFDDQYYQTLLQMKNGDGKVFEGFAWIKYRICK